MHPKPSSTDNPNELFDLIDDRDQVIGTVRRGDAHANPTLWHRSVQVLVFASDGRLFLQRRSASKDLFPGYYCASASGHVAAGEDYTETAHREVQEELGITLPLSYVAKQVVFSPTETEMTALYLARSDGPFHFHPTEIDGGDFFALADLRAAQHTRALPLTPALIAALEMLAAPQAREAIRTLFSHDNPAFRRVDPAQTL